MRDYAVDRSRVYVVGFSAGGAMAAVMAATYPDLYAAAGIHSGLAPRSARDVASAFEAMRSGGTAGTTIDMPLIVFHGDRDNIVASVNADRLIASRVAASPSFDGGETPGRSHSRKIYRDVDGRVIAEQWIVHGGSHAWSAAVRWVLIPMAVVLTRPPRCCGSFSSTAKPPRAPGAQLTCRWCD
jgi:poly(3-hydroxybutyrate) depolymerase